MGKTEDRELQPATADQTVEEAHSPLDERHFAMVQQAVQSHKAIDRLSRRTRSSSAIMLILGALTMVWTFFSPDLTNALIALALCVTGTAEWYGHTQVRRARSGAAKLLGINQLVLMGVIIAYCVAQMVMFSPEKAKAEALSPELRSQMSAMPGAVGSFNAMIDRWGPIVTYGFYGLMILIGVAFQGGTALYYFTRKRHIEAFARETPAWIQRLFIEMKR
ncbi:MAG: hypothetical protein JXL80_12915 [Planctomycetes bacterium]|nr:hypothetical protein [Planctomycetota bacterium]